jgi:hypothetical protein
MYNELIISFITLWLGAKMVNIKKEHTKITKIVKITTSTLIQIKMANINNIDENFQYIECYFNKK